MLKVKTFKNGYALFSEKTFASGLFCVWLRNSAGEIVDMVRCDTASEARTYRAAFARVAKAAR